MPAFLPRRIASLLARFDSPRQRKERLDDP